MSIDILQKESVRELVLPLSVEAYHKLGELGILNGKTELLEGVVIQKMPKNPRHSEVLQRLFKIFFLYFRERFEVRKEEPLILGKSEPEPDLALVDKKESGYFESHPDSAHLVIEVANSSLALDRSKIDIYADAGISEYWIVNLIDFQIEVFRNPFKGDYKDQVSYNFNTKVQPLIDPNFSVSLSDLITPTERPQ